MDVFKQFILRNVRPEYGAGTQYEYPVLIGCVATFYLTFIVVSYLINKQEQQRLAKQAKNDATEQIFTTFPHCRALTAELNPAEQDVSKKCEAYREKIGLIRTPITFIQNTIEVLKDTIHWLFVDISSHWFTKFIILPCTFAYAVARLVPGDHHEICDQILLICEFVVWWLGLGVLSSIGLGSGMHSGLLFLFPHIMQVALAANRCGDVNFPSYLDMWFRPKAIAFTCAATSPGSDAFGNVDVTLLAILFKILTPALLWGAGTAIGEIPPYAFSRAAALAGLRTADMEEVLELGQTGDKKTTTNPVEVMKQYTLHYINRFGFWAVLFFSAYPNALFDLCGICCGMSLMPFWTFFTATLIGKAFIKVPMQAIVMCTIFSPIHLKAGLQYLSQFLSESHLVLVETTIDKFINTIKQVLDDSAKNEQQYEQYSNDTQTTTTSTTTLASVLSFDGIFNLYNEICQLWATEDYTALLKLVWGYAIYVIIGLFVYSSIKEFVLAKQKDYDEEKVANMIRNRRGNNNNNNNNNNKQPQYSQNTPERIKSPSLRHQQQQEVSSLASPIPTVENLAREVLKQQRIAELQQQAQEKVDEMNASRISMSPYINPIKPTTPRLNRKSYVNPIIRLSPEIFNNNTNNNTETFNNGNNNTNTNKTNTVLSATAAGLHGKSSFANKTPSLSTSTTTANNKSPITSPQSTEEVNAPTRRPLSSRRSLAIKRTPQLRPNGSPNDDEEQVVQPAPLVSSVARRRSLARRAYNEDSNATSPLSAATSTASSAESKLPESTRAWIEKNRRSVVRK